MSSNELRELQLADRNQRDSAIERMASSCSLYQLEELSEQYQQNVIYCMVGNGEYQDKNRMFDLHVSKEAWRPKRECDVNKQDFDINSPIAYKFTQKHGQQLQQVKGEMQVPSDLHLTINNQRVGVISGKITVPARVAVNLYQRFGHKATDETRRGWLICDSQVVPEPASEPEPTGDNGDENTGES